MKGKLIKVGDQLALIIDKSILDTMHIDADTEVEISVDHGVITLSPLRESKSTAKLKVVDLAALTAARNNDKK